MTGGEDRRQSSIVRRSPPTGRLVVVALFSIATIVSGAATFWPTYASGQFVITVAVTVVAGTAIGIAGAAFRWPSAIVVLLTLAAFLVLGVPLAVPQSALFGWLPTVDGLVGLLAGSALSWKQLITVSTPVGSYEALLTPVFLLVLLASVVAPTLALRARWPRLAVVPAVVVFVAGICLGPVYVEWPVVAASALFVSVVVWLIWFQRRQRVEHLRLLASGRSARRFRPAMLGTVAVLAVAVAVGTAITVVAPAVATRDVLRSSVQQPFDPRAYPSPLSGFRNNFTDDAASEPLLTVEGLGPDRRIRIATLDTYNGVVYSVGSDGVTSGSGSFSRVPYRYDQSSVRGTEETLDVRVAGYSDVWVPSDGMLEDIAFSGPRAAALRESLLYNDVSGTLVTTAGLSAGDRYRVDVVVAPLVPAQALAAAKPGSATLPKLTGVPDALDTFIERNSSATAPAGNRLADTLEALARDGYVSHGQPGEPTSRSGHGQDRIAELFTSTPMVGDQEQYAVAAALIARRLGFPARVAVGYVAPEDAGSAVTFTGADASAWIEVDLRSQGWVTVNPNPEPRPVPESERETETKIIRPQTIVDPPPDDDPLRRDTTVQSDSEEAKRADDSFWAIVLGILASLGIGVGALAVVLAPLAAIVAAKARRRALRRAAPSPREQVVGGWSELADAALDFGYDPPSGATRSEFADELGSPGALVVATAADRAVFSRKHPSEDDAERLWTTVIELRKGLGEGRSRWERLRAALSLRSLGWRTLRSRAAEARSKP